MNRSVVNSASNPAGSVWHRWEPHIHTPGTILNDNYRGDDPWEDFLTLVENTTPAINALGVTDYYCLDSYRKIIAFKEQGRLKDVGLIFPNVELRYLLGTGSNAAINGHLLVSPFDPNHLIELERFLSRLIFKNGKDKYACSKQDLIKLGRDHDPTIISDSKALEVGATQFKVNFNDLLSEYKDSDWAKENIILAVAAGKNDGTSGLNNDTSFSEARKTIERYSKILFTSRPGDRTFWIGGGSATVEELERVWNGKKACIHGSDAHEHGRVGNPHLNRYTWIKGDLTFESLKQICIEPEHRVHIGEVPPEAATPSKTVLNVNVRNANWLSPVSISLNPGLVTIIGARGSGKTALADLMATGGFAISNHLNRTSFINRAKAHLKDVSIDLSWGSGETTNNPISGIDFEDLIDEPRVQYLSQQFVEQLCSSEGVSDELVCEIERVIFNAHPPDSRVGFSNFRDMLEANTLLIKQRKHHYQERIAQRSEDITNEWITKKNLPKLQKQKEDKEREIKGYKEDQAKLIVNTKADDKMQLLQQVTVAFGEVKGKLEKAKKQLAALKGLRQSIVNLRAHEFQRYSTNLRQTYGDSNLTDSEWQFFRIDIVGKVDDLIDRRIGEVEQVINRIKGIPVPLQSVNNSTSFIPNGQTANSQTFELLNAEINRLNQLIGIDNENGRKLGSLNQRLSKEDAELERIKQQINYANESDQRSQSLIEERNAAYCGVFDAIIEEQEVLNKLYEPLEKNLIQSNGLLSKLTFSVRRSADVEAWAERGENLLDLRKAGHFKGKGALSSVATPILKDVWEQGSADDVKEAMAEFRKEHERNLRELAPADSKDTEAYARWVKDLAAWLYSTDHINVQYGIQYDGVDIQQLSPGTRGIVLLLLYLAVDKEDLRPLLIDQPEENLDPKSIFDELVPLFREAKLRRQIIIVTHNANLVVNTDSDQVIVAHASPHIPGRLPNITYETGGLENEKIRKFVCGILEGGEAAFRERAKRLRVSMGS